MFSQEKNSRSTAEMSKEQSKIASGTKLTGDIEAKGGFRIDGTVEGNIKTPGKVVIGKDGTVNGNLECHQADIEGKFTGKMIITDMLSLRATAKIEGETEVGKLAIEPGAIFNASCTMNGGLQAMKKEHGKKSA